MYAFRLFMSTWGIQTIEVLSTLKLPIWYKQTIKVVCLTWGILLLVNHLLNTITLPGVGGSVADSPDVTLQSNKGFLNLSFFCWYVGPTHRLDIHVLTVTSSKKIVKLYECFHVLIMLMSSNVEKNYNTTIKMKCLELHSTFEQGHLDVGSTIALSFVWEVIHPLQYWSPNTISK